MDSHQTETIIRHFEEGARALRALATENESNKNLIKHLQRQLKEAKEKQKKQDQVMEEMRKEIVQLRIKDECSKTINIFVKTLTGKLVPIEMKSSDVIYVLKLKLRELEGLSVNQQHLIFQGYLLQDDKSLADCGLVAGSTVHLVLRLR